MLFLLFLCITMHSGVYWAIRQLYVSVKYSYNSLFFIRFTRLASVERTSTNIRDATEQG